MVLLLLQLDDSCGAFVNIFFMTTNKRMKGTTAVICQKGKLFCYL